VPTPWCRLAIAYWCGVRGCCPALCRCYCTFVRLLAYMFAALASLALVGGILRFNELNSSSSSTPQPAASLSGAAAMFERVFQEHARSRRA
jgi:hypothetical protein